MRDVFETQSVMKHVTRKNLEKHYDLNVDQYTFIFLGPRKPSVSARWDNLSFGV